MKARQIRKLTHCAKGEDGENEDPAGKGSRQVGRKAKAADSLEASAAKRIKTEDASAEAEVERILSNKVLDTNIPELDDMMNTGSKLY